MSLFLFHGDVPKHCSQEFHTEHEVLAVKYGTPVHSNNLHDIPEHSVVVPRYLAAERSRLEDAASAVNAHVLNTYQEYVKIADVDNWRHVLTMRSGSQAPRRGAVRKVYDESTQQIVAHTRRAFIYHGELLTWGYCRDMFEQNIRGKAIDGSQFYHMLHEVIEMTQHLAPFYAIDLVEQEDGSWAVMTISDGCMTPLEGNDPAKVWIHVAERVERLTTV